MHDIALYCIVLTLWHSCIVLVPIPLHSLYTYCRFELYVYQRNMTHVYLYAKIEYNSQTVISETVQ